MIKTQNTNELALLTKAEAKALTDRIRGHIDAAWKDIVRARDGKAWKALGYGSWEAYVKAEFGMSDRHSRRLLEQGEVIAAIEDATGPMGPLSERATRELKDDLPAAVEEIKARAEKGEDPAKAAKEIAADKRAEKEKAREERKAEQAKNDAIRDENKAALPPAVKAHEEAKAKAVADRNEKPADEGLSPEDRISELEESVRVLEAENEKLKAENKKFSDMKAQFDKGGFEAVISGKDEEIRVLETRLYRESEDKAGWVKSSKYWKAEAQKLGWSRDEVIDIETGEVVHG